MSWLPLGIVHFFAFAQRVFLGKGVSFVTCQECETRRGLPLPFWEGVGSVTRRTAVRVEVAPPSSEHALRKVSSSPGTWREEHALRLCCELCQSCFDDAPSSLPMPSHELPGSHWRVLAARPHCEVAVPRCHMSPRVPLFALFRPCYEGEEVVCQLCRR